MRKKIKKEEGKRKKPGNPLVDSMVSPRGKGVLTPIWQLMITDLRAALAQAKGAIVNLQSDLAQARADAAYQLRRAQSLCEKLEVPRAAASENARLRELLHEYRTAEAGRALAKGQDEETAAELRATLDFIASDERACCPEHVGFREYITNLKRELAAAQSARTALETLWLLPVSERQWRVVHDTIAPFFATTPPPAHLLPTSILEWANGTNWIAANGRLDDWTDPAGIIPPQNGARS